MANFALRWQSSSVSFQCDFFQKNKQKKLFQTKAYKLVELEAG